MRTMLWKRLIGSGLLILLLAGGCGKATQAKIDDLQTKNDDLSKRVTKLEDDLNEARKQLIQHQQAMQALNERVKNAEARVDQLAYQSGAR